jgi:hypothetical protein
VRFDQVGIDRGGNSDTLYREVVTYVRELPMFKEVHASFPRLNG